MGRSTTQMLDTALARTGYGLEIDPRRARAGGDLPITRQSGWSVAGGNNDA